MNLASASDVLTLDESTAFEVYGWGATQEDVQLETSLQVANVNYIPYQTCSRNTGLAAQVEGSQFQQLGTLVFLQQTVLYLVRELHNRRKRHDLRRVRAGRRRLVPRRQRRSASHWRHTIQSVWA